MLRGSAAQALAAGCCIAERLRCRKAVYFGDGGCGVVRFSHEISGRWGWNWRFGELGTWQMGTWLRTLSPGQSEVLRSGRRAQ